MSKQILDILVVEKDDIDFLAVKRHLNWSSRYEYRLTRATGYDEALQAAAGSRFDCALIDFSLNESGEISLVEFCESLEAPFPAVLLTGHQIRRTQADDGEGAFDIVEKTALTQQLLQRSIFHAINRHKALTSVSADASKAQREALTYRRLLSLTVDTLGPMLKRIEDKAAAGVNVAEDLRHARAILGLLSDNALPGERAHAHSADAESPMSVVPFPLKKEA